MSLRFLLRRHSKTSYWIQIRTTTNKCKKLNVLFFGTEAFSVPTLNALHREKLDDGCVSRLESCSPRMKDLVSPVRKNCDKLSIKLHDWPPDPALCEEFDLGIVASFGHLIPAKIIKRFPLGILNVHGSILPKYRGAAPIPYSIMNGDTKTGITIMEIQPFHFDIGFILAQEECLIHPDETRVELQEKMSHIGASLIVKVLRDLPQYKVKMRPQPNDGVSFAPKITKDMFEIRWQDKTADEVYNQSRALSDISKLYSFWKNSGAIVRLCDVIPPRLIKDLPLPQNSVPGQVFSVKNSNRKMVICIRCKEGFIGFERFYYGKKKGMNANDFHSGFASMKKTNVSQFVSSDQL